jgi:CheY-like chemotaxis protein
VSDRPLLLIEDSPEDAEALARATRKLGMVRPLRHFSTATVALQYLRREGPFDGLNEPEPGLILLDLNLPGTDGCALLAMIRADATLRHLSIVVLSSSYNPRDVAAAYAAGANAYQVKVMDTEALITSTKTMLEYWFDVAVVGAKGERR